MHNNKKSPQAESFLAKLLASMEELPHSQQEVCSFIVNHYQEVAFQTVAELALASSTSPSTIIRTIKSLKYGSYRDLQNDIRATLRSNNVSVWWELERSLDDSEQGPEHTFTWIARDNIETLQASATVQLIKGFNDAIELLEKSQRACIFGGRSTKAASFYLYYMLQQITSNAFLLDAIGAGQLYDELINFTPKDVFIALSFGGPHHYKRTLEAVDFAYEQGIPIILLTTLPPNIATKKATVTIYLATAKHHYSLVPVFTLIEALVIELGKRNKDMAQKKIRKIEETLTKQNMTL